MFNDVVLILWLVAFFYFIIRSENKFRKDHRRDHDTLYKQIEELTAEIESMRKEILDKETNMIYGLVDSLSEDINKEDEDKFNIRSAESVSSIRRETRG